MPYEAKFAVRAGWPRAASFRRVEELVEYRERFIDRHGGGFWRRGRDHVHRRLGTRRVGRGYLQRPAPGAKPPTAPRILQGGTPAPLKNRLDDGNSLL